MKMTPDHIKSLGIADECLTLLSPPTIEAIARITGLSIALDIWCRWAGNKLYIPANPEFGGALVKVIGIDTTKRLFEHFGSGQTLGVILDIPKSPGRFYRRLKAAKMFSDGASANDVAGTLAVSVAEAQRIRRAFQDVPL